METKKMLIIFGVILIIIQSISFTGLSKMNVGLFPDNDDLLYPQYIEVSDLNIKKAMFAIDAGFDRFVSGFEDLTYGEDEYRVMTATQMASAMVRESLNCSSGGSVGLAVYDTILGISYNFTGIIGAVLLLAAAKVKKENNQTV